MWAMGGVRGGDDAGQQGLEVCGHAGDPRPVKEVGAVLQGSRKLFACLNDHQCYTSHGQRLNFFEGLKVERQ
jgi:hypothetical protein